MHFSKSKGFQAKEGVVSLKLSPASGAQVGFWPSAVLCMLQVSAAHSLPYISCLASSSHIVGEARATERHNSNYCAAGQQLWLSQHPTLGWRFTEHITVHMSTTESRQKRYSYSHSKAETIGSQMSDPFPTYFKRQIQDMNFYLLTRNVALVLQHFAASLSVMLKQANIRL